MIGLLRNKKGFDLVENWVEYLALFFLIIGFILALFSGSAILSYMIVSVCGFLSGRLFYRLRFSSKYILIFVVLAFLIGFQLGDFYGKAKVSIFLFVLFNILSFYLHRDGYLRD